MICMADVINFNKVQPKIVQSISVNAYHTQTQTRTFAQAHINTVKAI